MTFQKSYLYCVAESGICANRLTDGTMPAIFQTWSSATRVGPLGSDGARDALCARTSVVIAWHRYKSLIIARNKTTMVFELYSELLKVSLLVQYIFSILVLGSHLSSLNLKPECWARIWITLYELKCYPFLWRYRNAGFSSLDSLYKFPDTYCKRKVKVGALSSLMNWTFILRKELMDFIPKFTEFCRIGFGFPFKLRIGL